MATTFKVRPVLALTNCPVARPDRVTAVQDDDVERGIGAIGVGTATAPDGFPLMFLSLHEPGGEVLMATMSPDDTAQVARQLVAMLGCLPAFDPAEAIARLN